MTANLTANRMFAAALGAAWLFGCASSTAMSGQGKSNATQPVAAASPKAQDAGSQPDDNNDETQVVAPQVASGAYLTCDTLTVTDPNPAKGYFGCDAMDSTAKRIPLASVKKTFVLYDANNKQLNVTPVSVPAAHVDVSWELDQTVLQAGVSASVTVFDAQGTAEVIAQSTGTGVDVNSVP